MEINDVSNFFYYMWNKWNKKECDMIFDDISDHVWCKWTIDSRYQIDSFYALLDKNCRDKLVSHAIETYNKINKK